MTESNTLLVEPFGGMAGDMFLAALLDLEDPRFRIDDLQRFAEAVVPGEATLGAERVWRRSLSGLHLDVSTPETSSPPHRGLAELSAMVERSKDSTSVFCTSCASMQRRVRAIAHPWRSCAPTRGPCNCKSCDHCRASPCTVSRISR